MGTMDGLVGGERAAVEVEHRALRHLQPAAIERSSKVANVDFVDPVGKPSLSTFSLQPRTISILFITLEPRVE